MPAADRSATRSRTRSDGPIRGGEPPRLTVPVGDRDHVVGPEAAPVTLVEYGDYECPFCGRAFPIVDSIREDMGDDLRFVFRHFPIRTLHPHAGEAAEAAEAAAAQDAFWAMHRTLYGHQDALDGEALRSYAASLDLDVDRFDRDLDTHRFADRVGEDFSGGVRSGVNGTPTFFIDGIRYDGAWDDGSLHAALVRAAAAGRGDRAGDSG